MIFDQIFDIQRADRSNNTIRDKYLSRVFGIFNEEFVRIWSRSDVSPYEDLGRPTIYDNDNSDRGSTLDFTLKDKTTSKIYVAEMKCEIQ